MTTEEKLELSKKIGAETTEKIDKATKDLDATAKKVAEEVVKNAGYINQDTFDAWKRASDKAVEDMKEIAHKQGTTLAELKEKLENNPTEIKSIAQVLKDDEEELKKIFKQGMGTKEYMLTINSKGQPVMKPFDRTSKAAGPHATVDDVGDPANVSSITQSLGAATLLRIAGGATIHSLYRNTPWIFELVNLINASYDNAFAIWFDEIAKDGASATVPEGGTKPLVQYKYAMRSAEYKKEAMMLNFTQEFNLDFTRLQSDILGKARIDLVNRINSAILPSIITAATAYNTAAEFTAGGAVQGVNDYDAIIAMSAQVKNVTFGAMPNAALMSTFKEGRMASEKDTTNNWIGRPDYLSNVSFVGTPDMGVDDVIVGDLKNYNVILRGGVIVRVGHNGTDFAENKFSTVIEQFYYDYIAEARKAAIVKGTTFAIVKQAISA